MEEEHTPTIIRLILSMHLALIQLKDSLLIFLFSQQFPTMIEIQGIGTQRDRFFGERHFRKEIASAYVN